MKSTSKTFRVMALSSLAIVSLSLLTACGGVRRTAYICSAPAGAECRVNGVYYGKTPVAMPYLWNWYYEINLSKEGYQPVKDMKFFKPAFYNQIPFDFVTESLPFPVRETKELNYSLTPTK
ncbi:PEGA domain-containing protein [Candidatus Sumerlaeota bacterium]|nr:PEGA domain-containing protein [Candidatus Sumerlaeales bacterium]NLD61469.1 PEGA domain-containing protein [Candidatus Sumerlaeota bacterium]